MTKQVQHIRKYRSGKVSAVNRGIRKTKDEGIIKPYKFGGELLTYEREDKKVLLKNSDIFKHRMMLFNKIKTPRVGDYLEYDGKITRFTYLWGFKGEPKKNYIMQTGGSEWGQYYLEEGWLSYSGGLDSGVKVIDLVKTNKTKDGSLWFFSEGISGAGRGNYYTAKMRVYKLKAGADKSGLHD